MALLCDIYTSKKKKDRAIDIKEDLIFPKDKKSNVTKGLVPNVKKYAV